MTYHVCKQQVPEEIERVMVSVEAYLSIRRRNSDTGLSFFEKDDGNERGLGDKVGYCYAICYEFFAYPERIIYQCFFLCVVFSIIIVRVYPLWCV